MTELEETIRSAGEGWLLDFFPDQGLSQITQTLSRADAEYKRRFSGEGGSLTPDVLIRAYRGNSLKIRAFLQALSATQTPEMIVMVWRILLGAGISRLELNYTLQDSFRLVVVLVSPYGEEETYASTNIDDAALVRHLGIMKLDGKPVFDGFYALNLKA